MTAARRQVLVCRDCRSFHGEEKPPASLCTCSTLDAQQTSCSCEATVIRAAAGIAGWGVIPTSEPEVVLTDARCEACQRDVGYGAQYRFTVFDLTPAERTPDAPRVSGTAASREAWARAASPDSKAAMSGLPPRGVA